MTYYNEHDPKAAAWLRELIKDGHIPAGDVDQRDIQDIKPHELTRYTQQHFFAGIGGWALALRLARWADDRPVRTGSCPCQPFSAAGLGLGEADARHLWPVFRDLITFGEATVTFGEQVASAAGRIWLARVRADLEGMGYGVGAADLCAAGVGSPNIRQRLFWLAHASGSGWRARRGVGAVDRESRETVERRPWREPYTGSELGRLGDSDGAGSFSRRQAATPNGHGGSAFAAGGAGGMADADGGQPRDGGLQRGGGHVQFPQNEVIGRVGHADHAGPQGRHKRGHGPDEWTPWTASMVLPCTDGKARRIEPGSFPLAHGIPGRVGLLRGYGNAINPWLASEFILACEEALN